MTTPNTSQTPETDAQEFRAFNRSSVTGNPTSTLFVVSSDFAKSLEERLIATEKRCKELKAQNEELNRLLDWGVVITLEKRYGKYEVSKLQDYGTKDFITIAESLPKAIEYFAKKVDILPPSEEERKA